MHIKALLVLYVILVACGNQEGMQIDFVKTPPKEILITDSNTLSCPVSFQIRAQATDFQHYFAVSSVHDDSAFLWRFSISELGITTDKQLDLWPYLRRFHDTLSEHYGLDKGNPFYEEDFYLMKGSLHTRFILISGQDGIILIVYQNPDSRILDYASPDSTILWIELDKELNVLTILFPQAGDFESETAHTTRMATHQKLRDKRILISDFTYHNSELVLMDKMRLMFFDDGSTCIFSKLDPVTNQTHCIFRTEDVEFKSDFQIDTNAVTLGVRLEEDGYETESVFNSSLFLAKRFGKNEGYISNVLMVNLIHGEACRFAFEEDASVLNFLPANNGIWLVMEEAGENSRLCFYPYGSW